MDELRSCGHHAIRVSRERHRDELSSGSELTEGWPVKRIELPVLLLITPCSCDFWPQGVRATPRPLLTDWSRDFLQLFGPQLNSTQRACTDAGVNTSMSNRIYLTQLHTKLHTFCYICKGLRVQPPLSSKFAVKKSLISSIRASLSCLYWVSIAGTGELDMNLTSLKVGIHRHCSINKLN